MHRYCKCNLHRCGVHLYWLGRVRFSYGHKKNQRNDTQFMDSFHQRFISFIFYWRNFHFMCAFQLDEWVHFSHFTLAINGNGKQFCVHKTQDIAFVFFRDFNGGHIHFFTLSINKLYNSWFHWILTHKAINKWQTRIKV